jgi:hypothetical protein
MFGFKDEHVLSDLKNKRRIGFIEVGRLEDE